MGEEGIDAAGDTGESDPIQAIEDALVTFAAEEIVLCTNAGGRAQLARGRRGRRGQGAFPDLTVRHCEIGLDGEAWAQRACEPERAAATTCARSGAKRSGRPVS